MADVNRASSFAKNIQKRAGRAKELFSQKLGKADRTTDEGFEQYTKNFNTQLNAAVRLMKELKNYHNCVKDLQMASKSVMELVSDLYEPNWIDHDKVQVKAQVMEKKWHEYESTIDEQVVKPLAVYTEQFSEMSAKILKRRRKLLDYDGCRHAIQSLEQPGKKKDESKLVKVREQLLETQNLYETINCELMVELSNLWNSRVSFLASNFKCLFSAECVFHSEALKIFTDLTDVAKLLDCESQKGTYDIKGFPIDIPSTEHQLTDDNCSSDLSVPVATSSNESYVSAEGEINEVDRPSQSDDGISSSTLTVSLDYSGQSTSTLVCESKQDANNTSDIKVSPIGSDHSEVKGNMKEESEGNIPAVKTDLLPGVLYQVKTTFQYVAEDNDELSFEPGEIINVTEFEDPEQQEEGWLMGFKENGSVKGLFPANFTIRLEQ